jgi:hypothetical protein
LIYKCDKVGEVARKQVEVSGLDIDLTELAELLVSKLELVSYMWILISQ